MKPTPAGNPCSWLVTGEIKVGGEQQEAETTFFVRDNGRGIAESDMPKVFALFRRASGDFTAAALAVRYVSGMTDRFALRLAVERLGWAQRDLPQGV